MKWSIPPPPIKGARVIKSTFLWAPREIGDYTFWLCFIYEVHEYAPERYSTISEWAWRKIFTTNVKSEAMQYTAKSEPLIEGPTKTNIKTITQSKKQTAPPPPGRPTPTRIVSEHFL